MAPDRDLGLLEEKQPAAAPEGRESDAVAALLRPMLAEWGLSTESAIGLIAESENATYGVDAPDGRRFVFRVHRAGYGTPAEIASEHAWIEALRRAETVETPAVLRRRDGTTIGALRVAGRLRNVAGFVFMTGREPEPDRNLPIRFARLGAITARLHRQSREWVLPTGFHRRRWTFETTLGARPHWGDWRSALGLDPAGRRLLERTVASIALQLAVYGDGPERFGLVHADLRLANLLVEGERLGVIDFDDCGFSWFMYDFAASVSFIEHGPIVDDLRDAWVEGYRTEGTLSAADEAMLPVFVMLRRILLTAWIASRPDAETANALGAGFTLGTLDLAERYLRRLDP